MVQLNGQGEASPVTEWIALKEAIGYLSKQVDADHITTQEQLKQVKEKLDLWIKTNQLLLESNQKLLQAVLANSQEAQRSTQSYDRGSQSFMQLEHQLRSFEVVTSGLTQALENLRQVWERQTGEPNQIQISPRSPTSEIGKVNQLIRQSHQRLMSGNQKIMERLSGNQRVLIAIIVLSTVIVLVFFLKSRN